MLRNFVKKLAHQMMYLVSVQYKQNVRQPERKIKRNLFTEMNKMALLNQTGPK